MKIIAFYLPQFHTIPENDEWWGEGFTEWVNVKNAKPLFEGHDQPRVPLHKNYYNLLDQKTLYWQADLANTYGIYGFCMYHYWFHGHRLLEKPVENFLKDKSIHIHFCICWANENWTNAWASGERKILIEQDYGEREDWEKHFYYLLPFFQDDRYIKEGNKPFMVILRPDIIECGQEMFSCWDRLARENGFDGMIFASQYPGSEEVEEQLTYCIEYQPNHAYRWAKNPFYLFAKRQKDKLMNRLNQLFHTHTFSTVYFEPKLEKRNYDVLWNAILTHKPTSDKCIPGAFIDWDNTSRRGNRGSVCIGATPEKFENYLEKLVWKARKEYKTDYLFLFSWNEWAEGGYLEPDEKHGYRYLEIVRAVLERNGELPQKADLRTEKGAL